MGNSELFAGVATGCLLMVYAGMTEVSYQFQVYRFLNIKEISISLITKFIMSSKLGGLIGSLFFGALAEVIGRQRTITAIYLPLLISSIMFQATSDYVVGCGASFIAGLSIGGTYTVVPMFIGEISTKDMRGRLIGLMYPSQQLGVFIIIIGRIILSVFVETDMMPFKNYSSIILAMFGILLTGTAVRETPYYYLNKGKEGLAKESLTYIRSFAVNTELEYDEIQSGIKYIKSIETGAGIIFWSIKRSWIKPLLLMISVYIFTYAVYVFPYYAVRSISDSSWNPWVGRLVISIVPFMASFLILFVVDTVGRKWTLMLSFGGMILVLIVFLLFTIWKTYSANASFVLYILFLISSNVGAGPIRFVLLGEIFPLDKKGIYAGISTALLFILQLFVLEINQIKVLASETYYIDIYISLVILVIALIIVKFYYVETRKRTLNEIQIKLR
ncbi:facilitated trehalose transporter Tret1-2 homolog [Diabrotica virgifera virgifera]|uniref:Major facilitator superfamily (MFS) profile domain-containing protein n=1 Tax=Diabrotica virgifera virgifera TaxID=50390 RepID=A0ABM5IJ51_DIAVI|nr:facilitated trehalose transporter Tret1-2 homolog [Diabrotica virgifera virgifera]